MNGLAEDKAQEDKGQQVSSAPQNKSVPRMTPNQSADRQAVEPNLIFTVDVEEWFQVGAFERIIDPAEWKNLESRIYGQLEKILSLMETYGARGTFFTLASVAQRCPKAVRLIVDAGHEVASHGCDHQRVFEIGEDAFAADCKRSKDILENASGQSVRGYRAPNFSFDTRTPWAHEVLEAAGYEYSSSIYPLTHDHYGFEGAERKPFKPLLSSDFIEFPLTTVTRFGRLRPASGGGFFRLLPFSVSKNLLVAAGRELMTPPIFYMHPWETDPGQPRVKGAPFKSRFRHYIGLKGYMGKLDRLLAGFKAVAFEDILPQVQNRMTQKEADGHG